MEEAVPIIRELIEFTPNADAKAELTRELAGIERVAEINRQIMSYNGAVALANRGEAAAALKILDEVLSKASDERVIHDATALRAKLEKRTGIDR
jgi:hypothetical protein